MKDIIQVITFTGCLLFITSCNNQRIDEKGKFVTYDIAGSINSQEVGNISEFCDDITILALDGKQKWVFPDYIIEGRFYKNHTLFYDRHGKGPIGIFGANGELVLVLNKRGIGLDEYSGITDFGMNWKEDKVYVVDGYQKRLLWYDYEGNWIESINLPTKCRNLKVLANDHIIIQNLRLENDSYYPYRLILTNDKGSKIQTIWEKPENIDDYPQYLDLYWIKPAGVDRWYYRDSPKSDTIYSITEEYKLLPNFAFNLEMTNSSNNLNHMSDSPQVNTESIQLERYFRSKNQMFVIGFYKKRFYFNVNLVDSSIKCYDKIDDNLIGLQGFPRDQTQDGLLLVKPLYVKYYKNNIEKLFSTEIVEFPRIQSQLKELISSSDESLQVILIYYGIKDID